ncbi:MULTISPECIES: protein jag [unclassified Desulfovibrio]|uniref:Jag family protein n=1 Tax=unclassified Desulfovibrio TaxID=2593640 RepID=UPI000F5ED1AD|nr:MULTISPECIES: protein jag [unclassified Desulfovibrio]RRD71774.1 protein jag [Desulfovibrio sp. OH1209_COT-279]RRD87987.1 protein jag [Desulfovibrio sp. OH1186_COT-070]
MEGFKEFQNKDLDSAIADACAYYNTEREKLEIEIIQDAKSGIFGIVGARKAKVRARRVRLREAVESILGKKSGAEEVSSAQEGTSRASAKEPQMVRESNAGNGRRGGARPACDDAATQGAPASLQKEDAAAEPVAEAAPSAPEKKEISQESRRGRRGRGPKEGAAEAASPEGPDDELEEGAEGLPATPLEQLDAERLRSSVLEAARTLVKPILGRDPELSVRVEGGKVHVGIDCGEDSGLLIGREGQTLAALQYMLSRIVSHGMAACVRIHLDAGDYRLRQDDKLREMALALAARVRESGRSCSTRPLSSYHRRIVHVCLQEVEDVQTRSSGDGPLKRVVITRRKSDRN